MAKENKEAEVVDLTERVQITHTDKNPHREAGEKSKVHPKVAEKLREKGWAK